MACCEANVEGDIRVDLARDETTGLVRTQVYLAPFDAVGHVPAFAQHHRFLHGCARTNVG